MTVTVVLLSAALSARGATIMHQMMIFVAWEAIGFCTYYIRSPHNHFVDIADAGKWYCCKLFLCAAYLFWLQTG